MENTPWRGLVLLFVALGLAGCAVARGPIFDTSSLPALTGDTARIIVFRQSATLGFGAGVSIPVKLDGQDFVEIGQSGYAWRDVPAGTHELSASARGRPGTARLRLNLPAGATTYVEASHSGAAVASVVISPLAMLAATDSEKGGPYSLEVADPTRALSLLKDFRRAN